ncbi:MAG: Omp28-related outer membrane protein [Crocinitomicaceae bacterium]
MKRIIIIALVGLFGLFQLACDKVENPIKPAVLLDTTIFPGNWEADYPEITWSPNTNVNRNIMLEDYTGHKCPNCPEAATEASNIEAANPGRVFVSSIHAGPGGLSSFQETAVDCGTTNNPYDKYCTEFFNDASMAYGAEFQAGFGFFGNPQGNINRVAPDGEDMFTLYNQWSTRVANQIADNDLKINIQAQSNYYPSTNGFFLHTETEVLEDLTSEYNFVVALIENDIVDWQDVNGTPDSLYHHHNTFRGCIDDLPWGRTISGGTEANNKTYLDYTYKLPAGQTNDEFHLLIYVYDLATYEVMQVIKHEF